MHDEPLWLLEVLIAFFQRMGVWSVDYIPRGVRFGPLLGEVQMNGAVDTLVCPAEAASAGGVAGDGGSTPPAPTTSPKEWKVCKEILVTKNSSSNLLL